MNLIKLTRSKCPHCKKHGLPFYKTSYKYNPEINCKYCGKKFKVNRVLSITVIVILAVVVGVVIRKIEENWFNIPTWIACLLGVILWLIFERFAPLEESDD